MNYTVKISGKDYHLPPRTLSVDEKIEDISTIDKRYKEGAITRRTAVETIFAFVEELAPGSMPALEEVDINELTKAALDIIGAYDAPVRREMVDAQAAQARELLKKPEIQKLLTAAAMMKSRK